MTERLIAKLAVWKYCHAANFTISHTVMLLILPISFCHAANFANIISLLISENGVTKRLSTW